MGAGDESDTPGFEGQVIPSRALGVDESSESGRPARRPPGSKPAAAVSRGRRLAQRLGAPLIVLIAVAVLFAFQNLTRVTISFWTVKVTSPLWIALYFWLIVGAVLGYVVARSAVRRSRR
jgi:uncharacterized integral membrane protein